MENQVVFLRRGEPPPRISKRSVAAIALIALLIDSLIVRSLILLAPLIRSGLEINESQFGYFMSALMLGTLLTTLPIGSLLEHFSTRWAFGIILTITGVGLFIVADQETFYGLTAMLFALGILRAGIIPLTNRVVAENFDPKQRGAITGFIFAAVPLGGFLGALVLPALGEAFDWGAGYQLMGIVAFIGGILAWILLSKDKKNETGSQTRMAFKTLGSKAFIVLAATYGLFALCMTTETYITLYLVDVVKISALVAGTFFGIIQLIGVVGRLFWGILADRYFSNNRWWLLAFTSGIMLLSIILLIRLTPQSPYWVIAIDMIGFGLSAASSWAILCTLVGDLVGLGVVANATAIIFFITNITDASGPVIFGNVLRITQSYQKAFGIYIALNAIVTLSFLWMALRNKLLENPETL
jgi:predicted MFS family arabinose efflux permease